MFLWKFVLFFLGKILEKLLCHVSKCMFSPATNSHYFHCVCIFNQHHVTEAIDSSFLPTLCVVIFCFVNILFEKQEQSSHPLSPLPYAISRQGWAGAKPGAGVTPRAPAWNPVTWTITTTSLSQDAGIGNQSQGLNPSSPVWNVGILIAMLKACFCVINI